MSHALQTGGAPLAAASRPLAHRAALSSMSIVHPARPPIRSFAVDAPLSTGHRLIT